MVRHDTVGGFLQHDAVAHYESPLWLSFLDQWRDVRLRAI